MPPKPRDWKMIGKMVAAGGICCIGGPALVYWVSPSEEELFLRYNPELQKRSLENRVKNQEEFDHFAMKLREFSKSHKPIWEVAAADDRRIKDEKIQQHLKVVEEIEARKAEIRNAGSSQILVVLVKCGPVWTIRNLIEELRRNSPSIRTLIFRIRLQPGARLPHRLLPILPLAIVSSSDPERVRLLTRVAAEIGTVKNTEIVTKNLGWWTKMWYKWAPLVTVREAGDELRIEFDVNTPQ